MITIYPDEWCLNGCPSFMEIYLIVFDVSFSGVICKYIIYVKFFTLCVLDFERVNSTIVLDVLEPPQFYFD